MLDSAYPLPAPNSALAKDQPIAVNTKRLPHPAHPIEMLEELHTELQPASANLTGVGISPRLLNGQIAMQPAPSPSDRQPLRDPAPPAPEGEELPKPKSAKPAVDDEIFRPIQKVGVDITPGQGLLPQNRAAERFAREGQQIQPMGFSRTEMETTVEWDAPAMCHRPLFFEDVNLERHGYHTKYAQPLMSAAHFFSRIPATPYLMVSQRSRLCSYTLGHYQPGSYAPYRWYYPKPSLTGWTLEGAVAVGLIMAIP
jgi:hypothetical protein